MADPLDIDEREAAIVAACVHLSDTLVEDFDVTRLVHSFTQRCVELCGGGEGAVALAGANGRLETVTSSTERSRLLGLFELQHGEGPCLDSFRSGSVVASDDLRHDGGRWPSFAPRATDVGFRAVLAVPLRLRGEIIGALALLRVGRGAGAPRDARLLQALATITTIGVVQQRTIAREAAEVDGLRVALTSRIGIEQAKGVLVERLGVNVDDAFGLLRDHARRHGLHLTDVAVGVVDGSLRIVTGPES